MGFSSVRDKKGETAIVIIIAYKKQSEWGKSRKVKFIVRIAILKFYD